MQKLAVLLCVIALAAVQGASLEKLRARTNNVLDAASAQCTARGGACADNSKCSGSGGTVLHNLCPGLPANVICCVPKKAPPPAAPVRPPVAPVPPAPAPGGASLAGLTSIASSSACAKYNFPGRGVATHAYLQGLSISYAKAVCRPTRPDVAFISKAAALSAEDVVSWYASEIHTDVGAITDGVSTVRALYTILTGLGMRESSGVWCTGRDRSASFTASATAEAGLFQTSYGSGRFSHLMGDLMAQYEASKAGCAAATYQAGHVCSAADNENWGAATEMGYKWQVLTKACPSFATEWAAVLLRYSGGAKGEWGPLRTRAAAVVPACLNMYKAVDAYVAANPTICNIIYQ